MISVRQPTSPRPLEGPRTVDEAAPAHETAQVIDPTPDLPPRAAVEGQAKAAPAPRGVLQRMAELAGRGERSVVAALVGAGMLAGVTFGAPLTAQAEVQGIPSAPAAVTERSGPHVGGPALPGSILNPKGVGNVSGATELFSGMRIGRPDTRDPQVDRKNMVADPNTVMTQNSASAGAAEIRRILLQHEGAPHTAEVIAAKLAELYGPYTAANTQANRDAIIQNLRWLADTQTGLRYDTPRAGSSDATTQSPNYTLSNGTGVCRDIHTAMDAVLASLINARFENGKWVPGSPTGQEGNVQTFGFANPSEYHAYMVYRDPGTGGWNALEYGKSYALNAPNAVDAFRSLPGYISGYSRYQITGWDSKPVVSDLGAVSAAAARAFIKDDPGVGEPGELRLTGSSTGGKLTTFVTPNLSITGALGPSEAGTGLDGGVKLNYHQDFQTIDKEGYIRLAGGMYTNSFEASQYTGWRGKDQRIAYRTYLVGVQVDGRMEAKAQPLIGEHLKFKYGLDGDVMLGLPISSGGLIQGAIADYSNVNLGADGMLLGQEILGPSLTFDWAVRARYEADALKLAHQLITSEGKDASALGTDALRTDFAMALTHKADNGLTTRFEAGGTQYMAAPFDRETTPTAHHYAVLTVAPESGLVNFGMIAKGNRVDGKFIPVNGVGVALSVRPTKDVDFMLGVDTVLPNGRFQDAGKNVQVTGNLRIRF